MSEMLFPESVVRAGNENIRFYTGRRGMRPDRKTLVLVHGSGGSHLAWGRQIQPLDKDVNIVALDLPGHGGSNGEPLKTVRDCAGWVSEFIERLALERPPFLAGMSLGGMIVLDMLANKPNSAEGAVLIGSGASFPGLKDRLRFFRDDYDGALEWFAGRIFGPDSPAASVRQSYDLMKKTRPSVLLNDFRAAAAYDCSALLGGIDAPVLIVCGDRDRVAAPDLSRTLHDGLKNSRLEIIDNAGHMVAVEKYKDVNRLILEFMRML